MQILNLYYIILIKWIINYNNRISFKVNYVNNFDLLNKSLTKLCCINSNIYIEPRILLKQKKL